MPGTSKEIELGFNLGWLLARPYSPGKGLGQKHPLWRERRKKGFRRTRDRGLREPVPFWENHFKGKIKSLLEEETLAASYIRNRKIKKRRKERCPAHRVCRGTCT